ncbi:MAG: hypothetical protein ACUVRD_08920 [Bacteroidia bacterium]
MEKQLFSYVPAQAAILVGSEPLVLHSHFHNHFIQAAIEDAHVYYDSRQLLIDTAQEVGYNLFRNFLSNVDNPVARLREVENLFRLCGYGKISLEGFTAQGGVIETPYEHYAYTYAATFPRRRADQPGVAFFAGGYLSGALEAVFDLPLGSMTYTQTHCLSKGDTQVRLEFRQGPQRNLQPSPGYKVYQDGPITQAPGSTMPRQTLRDGFLALPLDGDPQTGLIEVFEVVLSKVPATYYALISYRHKKAMEEVLGEPASELVIQMLIESGRVCAYNVLGSIMQSPQWRQIVGPYLRTREDWLEGILSVTLALGWGIMNITRLDPGREVEIEIWNAYETNAYLATYGKSQGEQAYFYLGVLEGVLQLLYVAQLDQNEIYLDGKTYNALFADGVAFKANQVESRLTGNQKDRIVLRRVK